MFIYKYLVYTRQVIGRNKILALVLTLALFLRIGGIIPGYSPFHSDEGISYSQGAAIISERSLDPQHGYGFRYNYPIVVPLVNAIAYLIFFIPANTLISILLIILELLLKGLNINTLNLVNNDDLRSLSTFIFGLNNIKALYWARILTALFGTGVVYLVYETAKKLFNFQIALVAAFFVAVNYRQVLNSHIGLPDIYNAFFLLLALLSIINFWKKQNLANCLKMSLAISVYFSTKLQLFALPPLFIVLMLTLIKNRKKLFLIPFVVSFVLFCLLFNSILLMHFKEAMDQIGYTALKYRYGAMMLDFYPLSYLYHIGIGQALSVLFIVGVVLSLAFFPISSVILLSIIIPFFVTMIYLTGGGFYTRNFVTITPLVLLFSAVPVYYLYVLFNENYQKISKIIIVICILLVSFSNLKSSFIIVKEYSKQWNFQIVKDWINKNIPENEIVYTHPEVLLPNKKFKVIFGSNPEDYSLATLREKKAQWAIVDLDYLNRSLLWWMSQNTRTSLRLWNRPDLVLLNDPITKIVSELKNYVVFEELNPWEAPESNFMIIKVPPILSVTDSDKMDLIYQEPFDKYSWYAENDGFGNITNFSWDQTKGFGKPGSLKVGVNSGLYFSQRFISPILPINKYKSIKISGMISSSEKITEKNKGCFLGIDFLDVNHGYLSSSLSGYFLGKDWERLEIISPVPVKAGFIRIFFQPFSLNFSSYWLDDVFVSGLAKADPQDGYIPTQFNPINHLFYFSHGGM